MNKVLAAALTIAALVAGQSSARAAGTFTVTNSGSTFTVTRSGNTAVAEAVNYRTVSLSAIAGQHFTAVSGELTFDAEHNTRTVTVEEKTPTADAYKYQTAASRTYRFEVTDLGGAYLAHCNRSITSGLTQFSGAKVSSSVSNLVTMSSGNFSSGMASGKYLDVNYTPPTSQVETSGTLSGYVLIDDEYDYTQKPATVSTSTLISSTGAPASYLNTLGYKIYATVCFTEKEKDDGYQYLQIIAGTSSHAYDGADPNGKVNDPENSVYKVCFEFANGSNAEGKIFFPHRFPSNGEFSNSDGVQHEYKFKDGDNWKYDGSGAVILPVTTGSITTRFDAGGNNDDTWGYKDLFVRMALQDGTAPTRLGDPVVAPGHYGAGTTVYISVPFSEMVTASSDVSLHTDWGDFACVSGSGSNVLTVSGIRIYKPESGTANGYQGLFGYVGSGGTVHDVNLADARITGQLSVGGIVGLNYGTVQNCTVADNVLVASNHTGSHYHGGIVGKNYGSVSGCTSAVTLTAAYTGTDEYSAVVGWNDNGGTVENCLALGATIPAMEDYYGVIVGYNISGTLTAFDSTTGTLTLTFTDEGAVTTLVAGTPYIIKWNNTEGTENLVSPTFTDVTIPDGYTDTKAINTALATAAVSTTYADFLGTFAPIDFTEDDRTVLFLGAANTLCYPTASAHIGAFRAYFQLGNDLTAGDPATGGDIKTFKLNLGDGDATGIRTTDSTDSTDSVDAWYTLDGRKLDKQPTKAGLYINGGRKVVIK